MDVTSSGEKIILLRAIARAAETMNGAISTLDARVAALAGAVASLAAAGPGADPDMAASLDAAAGAVALAADAVMGARQAPAKLKAELLADALAAVPAQEESRPQLRAVRS